MEHRKKVKQLLSEVVKALKQRIDELQGENIVLKSKLESIQADNDCLQERILDLEACR